jgi:hypothetical protein
MDPDSPRLMVIDAVGIAAVSIALCAASKKPLFMTVIVPTVIIGRMVALAIVARKEDVSIRAELVFFALCTALGALNDWNSVCNKKIYEYTVPAFFRSASIPFWMLIYWGMILRFVARVDRWKALGPDKEVSNALGINGLRVVSPAAKIVAEFFLVAATRWALYRYYLDPVLSWLPFLVALFLWFIFFMPSRHDLKLLGIFLIGGPTVEILYSTVGHLHSYHLGWIGGIPVWIVLWWVLAILIWKDLAFRIEKGLRTALAS